MDKSCWGRAFFFAAREAVIDGPRPKPGRPATAAGLWGAPVAAGPRSSAAGIYPCLKSFVHRSSQQDLSPVRHRPSRVRPLSSHRPKLGGARVGTLQFTRLSTNPRKRICLS
jgi:hypothetical protein